MRARLDSLVEVTSELLRSLVSSRDAGGRRVAPVGASRNRTGAGAIAVARAAPGGGDRVRRRLLRLQLEQGRPDAPHLRRPAQHVLAEPGRGRLREGPDAREPGGLPDRPRLRQDRRSQRRVRAGERRQGDLQAHRAGLRQPAHRQGAVGRGQVRDAPGRGGGRVPGQLELHAFDPVRLCDPLLPRGRARDLQRDAEGHPGGPARERLEQRQRDQRQQDGPPQRDAQAEREA